MSRSAAAVARFPGAPDDLPLRVDAIGRCRPPLVRGAHAHEYHALLYFTGGGARHELDGEPCVTEPGELVAIPPGVAHDVGDADGVAVTFMPAAADRVRFPRVARRLVVPAVDRIPLRWLIDRLAHELREQRPDFRAAARAQLTMLLVGVGRLGGPDPPADPVLGDVLEIIERRFREPLSLAAIAGHVSRSPRHLTRTVRALTGATVMHLVDERRMAEARRLLLETDAKVEAIARTVGFHDDGYFRRRFRQAHGLAPKAWRERNR
ncbi:MAG TPA: AraC family transcriptional regulator [Solirubrobacteraceae bacterium]|nr:AraC family transcriptional regulator [Solirubrobacteraceae bacterium]